AAHLSRLVGHRRVRHAVAQRHRLGRGSLTPAYFIRSWILAMAARAHSSSNWPPGAPLTPIAPIAFPPAMIVTPPTAYVTLGSGVCGTVVAGFLAIRSATAFVLSSLRASVSDAAEYALQKALSSVWIGAPLPRSSAWRTPSSSTTTAVPAYPFWAQ